MKIGLVENAHTALEGKQAFQNIYVNNIRLILKQSI
jgi:hypothetical protein